MHTHTFSLTCVSLVVFQHVDLLGELALTLLTLVLFDALVELHVVPQSMFGLHTWAGKRWHNLRIIQPPPVQVYSFSLHGGKRAMRRAMTFPALGAQVLSVVVVHPEMLLQHVLSCKRFAAFVTAVALHPWMSEQTSFFNCDVTFAQTHPVRVWASVGSTFTDVLPLITTFSCFAEQRNIFMPLFYKNTHFSIKNVTSIKILWD